MSKTPFEIRLDLLAMAQSILGEQSMNERIRLENDWNTKRDVAMVKVHDGTSTGSEVPNFPEVPKYSVDEVIELAKKLNDFVSNSPNKE